MVDLAHVKLTKAQQKLADFIYKNMEELPFLTEKDIAEHCGTSVATVSRFWGAAGYENLKAFKQAMKDEQAVTPANKVKSALKTYNDTFLNQLADTTKAHLDETLKHTTEADVKDVVELLAGARRIYLYGAGSAQSLLSLLQFRLSRFGCDVLVFPPSGHEIFEELIHIQQEDVMVVFGFVQSSPEIRVLFDVAIKVDCQTILVTDLLVSPMREEATKVLYAERGGRSDFHSMIAPMLLIESLVVALGRQLGDVALQKLDQLHRLRKTYEQQLPKK
ncbi:MurR/RpiR family transcriptional regulator [Aureibacillus halotolerans]|uniref:RpiR family transcriptional regulator n=1 Tax=Aureibacillus halotolerans TaxID=1508390 RepID=A0A4R6UDD3_9BACI|nr:MurR/RpiR family transcriptional regulator [Aureibacillus halotolerans]TDQ41114.1 RpiR family transcriptional regulator [Aureibacillus halotolerans]